MYIKTLVKELIYTYNEVEKRITNKEILIIKKEKGQKMKLKMERGITLIALAITIIVLLLLVGVTIATLTGENGILNKANTAKTETTKQGAKEKVQVMGSYGLEGNAYEHIAEKNTHNTIDPFNSRGGSYIGNFEASYHIHYDGKGYGDASFRLVCYVI